MYIHLRLSHTPILHLIFCSYSLTVYSAIKKKKALCILSHLKVMFLSKFETWPSIKPESKEQSLSEQLCVLKQTWKCQPASGLTLYGYIPSKQKSSMLSNWYTSNEDALFTQFQYNCLQTGVRKHSVSTHKIKNPVIKKQKSQTSKTFKWLGRKYIYSSDWNSSHHGYIKSFAYSPNLEQSRSQHAASLLDVSLQIPQTDYDLIQLPGQPVVFWKGQCMNLPIDLMLLTIHLASKTEHSSSVRCSFYE